jgi:glycosyltransferase involved in cell wall biosynthesis
MSGVDPRFDVAVVVLSFGPRETLPAAVRSLTDQDVQAEVIVVHSGSGDPGSMLKAQGLDVPVVLSSDRLYPGGARNLGIERTTAPVVAFLADDCTAEPGWVRVRRDAHAAGHAAVASALVPHRPQHPTTLAVHLSRQLLRMPAIPPERALRFGVSYSRDTLLSVGPFDAGMPHGEDAVYNARLIERGIPIVWEPGIVTAHRGPERLRDALPELYRRGRGRVRVRAARGDVERTRFFRRFLQRMRFGRKWIPRVVAADQRRAVIIGAPAYALCIAATTLGEWREGWRR